MDSSGFNTFCVKNAGNICIQNMITYDNMQTERNTYEKYARYGIDVSKYMTGLDEKTLKYGLEDIRVIVSLTSYPHRFQQPDFLKCLRSLVE